MNRLRTTLALSALAIATAGGIATAGPDAPLTPVAPQITDATGDSLGDAGSDIVSVGFTTSGAVTSHTILTPVTTTVTKFKTVKTKKKVKVKGKTVTKTVTKKVPYTTTVTTTTSKTVKSYTPDTLVLTLTTAGTPDLSPGSYAEIDFTSPKCGAMFVSYSFSAVLEPAYASLGTCDPASSDPTATGTSFGFTPTVSGNTVTFELPFAQLTSTDLATPGTELTKLAAVTGISEPVEGAGLVGDAYDDAATDTTYTIG